MEKQFTRQFEDNSIKSGYAFTFFCDICGKPYHTQFKSYAEVAGHGRFLARKLALAQAVREAKLHFNRCVHCHRWVCDHDFDIETGLCRGCMKKNNVKSTVPP